MLALVLSPQHQQVDQQPAVNSQTSLPIDQETNQAEGTQIPQSSESAESKKSSMQVLPSEPDSSEIEKDFVIPKGVGAERIAELLLAQGFIKDKEVFLDNVHQLRVQRRFQAGTFKLTLGLTEEELIKRLLKK